MDRRVVELVEKAHEAHGDGNVEDLGGLLDALLAAANASRTPSASCAPAPTSRFARDQVQAALVIVERLRSTPWVQWPAHTTGINRQELDGDLSRLRAYLVDADAAIAAAEPGSRENCRGCGTRIGFPSRFPEIIAARGLGAYCCQGCCDRARCTDDGCECPYPARPHIALVKP